MNMPYSSGLIGWPTLVVSIVATIARRVRAVGEAALARAQAQTIAVANDSADILTDLAFRGMIPGCLQNPPPLQGARRALLFGGDIFTSVISISLLTSRNN
jgi:hypothetical protein